MPLVSNQWHGWSYDFLFACFRLGLLWHKENMKIAFVCSNPTPLSSVNFKLRCDKTITFQI